MLSVMGSKPIRFSFVIQEGPNTGLSCGGWRVLVNGDDIYITSKALGGTWKASLHASGRWRVAATSEIQSGDKAVLPTDVDRAMWKFAAPAFDRGMQAAFAIWITRSAMLPSEEVNAKEIVIPVADQWNRVTEARISVTEPNVEVSERSQVFGGPLTLASGRHVWLTSFSAPVDEWDAEPEPVAMSSMLQVITPESDGSLAPGFLVRGIHLG